MKTQISNLINGQKNVRREENNEKYLIAKQATSHRGFAGTNNKKRMTIAEQVIAENPDKLNVEILGKQFTLNVEKSVSGKTTTFITEISLDDFMLISDFVKKPFDKFEAKYHLTINNDMTIRVDASSRKTAGSMWITKHSLHIGEEFITIL